MNENDRPNFLVKSQDQIREAKKTIIKNLLQRLEDIIEGRSQEHPLILIQEIRRLLEL